MAALPATAKRRLSDLRVHYISLVQAAANGRAFIAKQAKDLGLDVIEKCIRIVKNDPVRKMVYGIVYAPDETDTEGDTMTAAEIEKSAYGFMQGQRTASVDTDHSFETGAGFVAESWILREGDPLFPAEPVGAWAVGIKVTDDETWGRVEKGELTGLSLAGLAKAEPVALAAEDAEDVAESFVGKVRRMLVGDLTFWHSHGDGATAPAPKIAGQEEAGDGAQPAATTPPKEGDPAAGQTSGSEPVEKSFKEKLLQGQLWRVADALSEALREVLQDDTVTDKVAAARQVCEEFVEWLEEEIGEAVAKGSTEGANGATAGQDGRKATAPASEDGTTGASFARLEKQIGELLQVVKAAGEQERDALAQLTKRVEHVERQTPGRQTLLGGDDEGSTHGAVQKGKKPYKGLRFAM